MNALRMGMIEEIQADSTNDSHSMSLALHLLPDADTWSRGGNMADMLLAIRIASFVVTWRMAHQRSQGDRL